MGGRTALKGEWQPALERLSGAIAEHTGIRDYLQGEEVVQGFLAVYLSAYGYFVFHTVMELAKGYADIVLVPRPVRNPPDADGVALLLKNEGSGRDAELAAREG